MHHREGGLYFYTAFVNLFNLSLGSLTWTGIQTLENLYPRAGHTAICLPDKEESGDKDKILIFGGGDNLGEFFNDFFTFHPQPIDQC
jgi:hypothetical protein